jgi:hypothetical protein
MAQAGDGQEGRKVTTILYLRLDDLDVEQRMIEVGPEGRGEFMATARDQVERVARMVRDYEVAAFIHEEDGYFTADRIACIIPVALADELLKEGRLKWPLYTSMTVPARGWPTGDTGRERDR